MAPLRLERDSTILLPKADSSSWEFFVDNLPHYDDFIVYRKGNLHQVLKEFIDTN